MSVARFRERITDVLDRIWTTQIATIEKVAAVMADCIGGGGLVHMFGSVTRFCRCKICSRAMAFFQDFGR